MNDNGAGRKRRANPPNGGNAGAHQLPKESAKSASSAFSKSVGGVFSRIIPQATIKQYIFLFFIFAVIIPASIIGYLSYANAQNSIRAIISIDADKDTLELHNSLESFLSAAPKTNDLINNLIVSGTISSNEKDLLGKNLLYHIKSDKNIMSIDYADESGELVGAARDIFEMDYGIGKSGKSTNYTYNLYAIDTNSNLKEVVWKTENFDPKVTPWYALVKKTNMPGWTPIYLWPNGEFGIDFVSPLKANGTLFGVLDVAIKMNYITSFLEQNKHYPNSQLFILEKDGLIVAGTDIAVPVMGADGTGKRESAINNKNPVLRDAAKYLISKHSNLSNIKDNEANLAVLNNKNYYLHISNFKDDYGLDWVIISATPEEDLFGELNVNARNETFIIIFLVIFAISFAWNFSQYINVPLTKLVYFSKSLAQGNLDADFEIKRSDEIGVLAESFKTMAGKMKNQMSSIRESEERLQIALESTRQGVWDWNLIADKIFFSPQWKKMLGYEEHEISNDKSEFESRVHPDDLPGVLAAIKDNIDGVTSSSKIMHRLRTKNGNYIWVEGVGKIIEHTEDGKPSRMIGILIDITEKKKYELYLSTYNKKLQQEVSQRTKDITAEKKKVEELSKVKDELIRDISHELKTPLSVIIGNIELLKMPQIAESPEKRGQIFGMLERNTMRLKESVVQILNASRLTSIEMKKEVFLLDNIIRDIVDEHAPLAKKKGIRFSAKCAGIKLAADSFLIGLAIKNIVSNAIKFTDIGEVDIKAWKSKGLVHIRISDTGKGMSPKEKTLLFTRFFKADATTPGSGIGLVTANEIISKHNGKITVETKKGEGTAFTIVLPSAK